MKESSTYRAILEEGAAKGELVGRLDEAKQIILRVGTKRFGVPDAATQTKLETIQSLDELERLSERLLDVESWEELLA